MIHTKRHFYVLLEPIQWLTQPEDEASQMAKSLPTHTLVYNILTRLTQQERMRISQNFLFTSCEGLVTGFKLTPSSAKRPATTCMPTKLSGISSNLQKVNLSVTWQHNSEVLLHRSHK